MPKLTKSDQKVVEDAKAWEAGGFLIEAGRYAGRLEEVKDWGKGPSGFNNWSWTFKHLHNEQGEEQRGAMFHNTSLSPKAAGGLKATFTALGFSADSDTDEMIGEWAVLHVVQEIAAAGKKAGQLVNRVTGIAAFVPEDFDFDADAVPEDEEAKSSVGAASTGSDF